VDSGPWQGFLTEREAHLRALAEPILECVARDDTGHPAFHGCYDWHSAVHGTWALLALSRATGDPAFAAAAEAELGNEALAAELSQLQSGGPFGEVPYGYAWLLVLAAERSRGGHEDLAPLASVAADALEDHLSGLTATQIEQRLVADEYANLSWEALALWEHARIVGDSARVSWVEDFVREEVLSREAACPLSTSYSRTAQFFPPCLHRALLLLTVLSEAEAAQWVADNVPADWELDPLDPPSGVHAAGLNFSRSWGLYALYRSTGDDRFLEMYIDHIETHLAQPALWAENYDYYSHWVPQFGVYGILLSFAD